MQPGLDALLPAGDRAAFAASYAAGEPFVAHGLPDAFADLPLLASREALLGAWPLPVRAHLPDVADEISAIATTPTDAAKLFACGMSLLFDDVETVAPTLGPWLAALRVELALPALTQARCLVYATPAGGGTALHFDQNVNLVVQLHGTKRWTLATNAHVEAPMTRHTAGLPADAELATYARTPLPDAMPPGAREIVLRPGSLLLVPRGVWHATHADTDALALNFTFTAPTWIDVFAAALRSKLALDPAWRATAAPASPQAFEALLRELADDAATWRADDILAVTEGADRA